MASRSGLEALCKMHPDVEVHLASIDELSEVGTPFIGLPGNALAYFRDSWLAVEGARLIDKT